MVMTLLTRPKKTVATVVVATDGSGDYNCDGTADDVEINAAINSLPAGGGCIYIKEGTYNLTASIILTRNNLGVIGCGSSTILQTNVDPIIMMYANANRDDILIKNLYFYGNQTGANCNGLILGDLLGQTITNTIISECWFERFSGTNLVIYFGSNVIIKDCIAFNNNRLIGECIRIANSSDCICANNRVYNSTDTCIHIEDSTDIQVIGNNAYQGTNNGIWIESSDRCQIISNSCYDNGYNIALAIADDNVLDGNICRDATNDGISINGDDNIVSNNKCIDNDRYEIRTTGTRTIISGNNCVGTHVAPINDAGTDTQIFNNIES